MTPLLFRNRLDPDTLATTDPLSLPLVPLADLPGLFTYLGQFFVPVSGADASVNNFSFCESGLTPVSDGVYLGALAGAAGQQRVVGKISLPAFGGTATVTYSKVTLSGAVAPS